MEASAANKQKEAAADGFECRKHKDGTINGDFIPSIHPSSLLFLGMRNEDKDLDILKVTPGLCFCSTCIATILVAAVWSLSIQHELHEVHSVLEGATWRETRGQKQTTHKHQSQHNEQLPLSYFSVPL